jgi:cytochrome c-type biogenesis protein
MMPQYTAIYPLASHGLVQFMASVGASLIEFVKETPLGLYAPFVALILGLLNTLNPCTVSVLPLWMAYVFGQTHPTDSTPPQRWQGVGKRLHLGVLFTLGMVITLSVLGILALQLRWVVFGQWNQPVVWITLGVMTLLLGVSMLLQWNVQAQGVGNTIFKRFNALAQRPALQGLRPLLLGMSFSLILSPCSTPFLVALMVLLAQSPHPAIQVLNIVAYSLGQGLLFMLLPLVLAPLQASLSAGWLHRLNQASAWVMVGLGLWFIIYAMLSMAS